MSAIPYLTLKANIDRLSSCCNAQFARQLRPTGRSPRRTEHLIGVAFKKRHDKDKAVEWLKAKNRSRFFPFDCPHAATTVGGQGVSLVHQPWVDGSHGGEAGVEWLGYHAFRRGLATNLCALGTDDLTISEILRHSDVKVTRASYIKVVPRKSVDAMNRFGVELAKPKKRRTDAVVARA